MRCRLARILRRTPWPHAWMIASWLAPPPAGPPRVPYQPGWRTSTPGHSGVTNPKAGLWEKQDAVVGKYTGLTKRTGGSFRSVRRER